MEIIQSILGFFIAIGILVTFHEYGHFYVARFFNVKVLNFSIGFGRNIYTKKPKNSDTVYSIGIIPLGGYVKMLESSEFDSSSNDLTESNFKKSDLQYCFDKQSVYKRFLIVAAGPIFNLILAVIFFTFVHFAGITGMKPVVDSINLSSETAVAKNSNYNGFEIYQVNNKETMRWQDVRMQVLDNVLNKQNIILSLKNNIGERKTLAIDIKDSSLLEQEGDILNNIGIIAKKPEFPPVIGTVQKDTPAYLSGLEPGDKILTINDKTIDKWSEWINIIQENPNNILQLNVLRDTENINLILVPSSKSNGINSIGYAGVSPNMEIVDEYRVIVKYPFIESVTNAVSLTYYYSILTFKMIFKLFFGEANLNNLSGPLSIAEFSGKSLSMGFVYFAYLLAILSISLGVLNLLPIPVLDGGHLLYYTFEIIFGRPVPEKIQLIGQQLGIVILFSIMIIAFYNDILRIL